MLAYIYFEDGSSFPIYNYKSKHPLQAIGRARFAKKAIAGALYPYIKSNLYEDDGIYRIKWGYEPDQIQEQLTIYKDGVGHHRGLQTANNVPSYIANAVIKIALFQLAERFKGEIRQQAMDYVLSYGLKCFRCQSRLVRKKGNHVCPNGHWLGLSKLFFEINRATIFLAER